MQADTLQGRSQAGGPAITWEAEVCDTPDLPGVAGVIALWRAKHRTDGPPHRSDLTASDLKGWLPSIFIAEPSALGWRFRLVGTAIERSMGVKAQGRTVAEVYRAPESIAKTNALYETVTQGGAPVILRGRFGGLGIDYVEFETALMPVIGEDGHRWVFAGMFERPRKNGRAV